jgi:nicotinamidase-related amidase
MSLTLPRRSQKLATNESGYLSWSYRLESSSVDPRAVAILVCDMWDRHWSRAAMERGDAIAVRIDAFLTRARAAGMTVIHAPSETMKVYDGTPARRRILEVPRVALPEARQHADPLLPVDDTDGGSDTNTGNENTDAALWTKQTDLIHIDQEHDVISDNGAEIYSFMRARGIQTILICGVHTNMCVLDRSFAIKSFTTRGLDIVLLRDLTDSLYNPSLRPYVSHDEGTELIIGYIEKFWCPSVTSTEIVAALGAAGPRASAGPRALGGPRASAGPQASAGPRASAPGS